MFAHGSASLQLFLVVWVFPRPLGVICYDRWVLNEVHKNSRIGSTTHSLPFYVFSKFKLNELWPCYQKHVSQIIFEALIWILWIFPSIKLYWNSCSVWDKPGWLNWFGQFLCEGLSSFNPKRLYYSYAWSCSLYERRTSFCTGLSLENSGDSYLCFRLALLHSISYFFSLYRSPSSSLCMVFDSISSNVDEVLSINPSANVKRPYSDG